MDSSYFTPLNVKRGNNSGQPLAKGQSLEEPKFNNYLQKEFSNCKNPVDYTYWPLVVEYHNFTPFFWGSVHPWEQKECLRRWQGIISYLGYHLNCNSRSAFVPENPKAFLQNNSCQYEFGWLLDYLLYDYCLLYICIQTASFELFHERYNYRRSVQPSNGWVSKSLHFCSFPLKTELHCESPLFTGANDTQAERAKQKLFFQNDLNNPEISGQLLLIKQEICF
ncbi:hypothetical protein EGR_06996 [Echinococcus granulosus]|uniref:Uncharacterized protein n=1 Tax=Echinococcus granulosus TaxID=6210 RepID=W6UC46_ECHGR|nr:hypothetical protein EGR_06996 [Echinococcus granulosus]EUB58166.1 hypothetical protein EGR_06996 [Echinococcus granulosus]